MAGARVETVHHQPMAMVRNEAGLQSFRIMMQNVHRHDLPLVIAIQLFLVSPWELSGKVGGSILYI